MALKREETRELEEHRAEFRALMDRVERLSNAHPLQAATERHTEEMEEVRFELEMWERVLAGDTAGLVIVVTGGRNFGDRDFVYRSLDRVHSERRVRLLVQGGATGADELAKDWAIDRGVPWETVEAKWDDIDRPGAVLRTRRDGTKYDAAAGNIRNGVMLDKYQPGGVVAFPGGRGTNDCCEQAEARRIKVWRPHA